MSILQSDIINSFIDQPSNNNYENNNEEIQTYPSLHQYNQIENMYDLLLQKNNNSINDDNDQQKQVQRSKSLTNDNLYQFNYQFTASTTTPPIIHTINPKQLTPKISSISSSSSSSFITSSEFEFNDQDSNSIDLETPISTTPINTSSQIKPNNWSMNDEFKDAIATWINQNNNSTNQTTKKKSNSISTTNSNPKFQRTSITKRRKSDSLVASLPNLSLDPPIQLSNTSTTSTTTSTTTTSSSTTNTNTTTTSPSATPLIPEEGRDHSIGEEEEKPFKCDGCTKAFRRSEHLKRHVRSVHSNVRPFPCKFCEKKFSRSDNLAQHLRTHNKH